MKSIPIVLNLSDEDCAALTRYLDANSLPIDAFMKMAFEEILSQVRQRAPSPAGTVVPFRR